MSKTKKILACVALAPFLLFFILACLLYVPSVQNWLVGKVTAYVTENTPWGVSVGRVRLVFPLDLGIDRFVLTQAGDSVAQQTDTIADVRDFVVDVKMLPLFSGDVVFNGFLLKDARINTCNLVSAARVYGKVGRLSLSSGGVGLGKHGVRLDKVGLRDADVVVMMSDSVPEDTSQTKTDWTVAVSRIAVANTSVDVHMPGDTLGVRVGVDRLDGSEGFFDLGNEVYRLASLEWNGGTARYDNRFAARTKGLDVSHIAVDSVALRIDSIAYDKAGLALSVANCAFRERCGLVVKGLRGGVYLDSLRLRLPSLALTTPTTALTAKLDMELNAFSDTLPGRLHAGLTGHVGFDDVARITDALPRTALATLRRMPLHVDMVADGNMRSMSMQRLKLSLPRVMSVEASGSVRHLDRPNRMSGMLSFDAKAPDAGRLKALLPASVSSSVNIPRGMRLTGKASMAGSLYSADMTLRQGGGRLGAVMHVDTRNMAYGGRLTAEGINIDSFVPGMRLGLFSGQLKAKGRGTDIYSPRTNLTAALDVSRFAVARRDFSGLRASVRLVGGVARAELSNDNDMVSGNVTLSAIMHRKKVDANLVCNLAKVDFQKLRITKKPFTVSLNSRLALATDLSDNYKLQGVVADINMRDSMRTYHPENVVAELLTRTDTTSASISCGDFLLRLNAHGGYKRLMRHGDKVLAELKRQMEQKYIDQLRLRSLLPEMCLTLSASKENVFTRMLNRKGMDFKSTFIDMDVSPVDGINGIVRIDSLMASGIQLDTLRLDVKSDSVKTVFDGRIANNRHNPQYVFTALFGGALYERGVFFGTRVLDSHDRLGVALGMKAAMEPGGIRISVGGPVDPVFGYKRFSVNKDNYIFLADNSRVSADIDLHADDGTGLQVFSNDSTEAQQDITVGLHNFELSKVMSVLPYLPDVSGVMNGDFHVIKTVESLSVSSSVTVDNMVYEGSAIGNVGSEFVYMPLEDGTHYVDGTLECNGHDVGAISGSYNSEGEGSIDASLKLSRTPLNMLNGFVDNQVIGFRGYCTGEMNVKGQLSHPHVDGSLALDSAYIVSTPYGVELRFADTPVRIEDSRMRFDDFKMYAHNRTPLTINGYLDFSNLDDMRLDTRIMANNYLLIDSKENARSEAYGKAYVNFLARASGPLTSLSVRGKLDVLGTTDMTYILRDSPLSTDTQLDDLVKFTDFNQKKEVSVERPVITGVSMDLNVNIDEGAHIMCALNADKSNYVDLIGGGSLRMQYDAVDELRLTGRYTLSNGEMKYSLPVIPLKTFTIQDGSYVEFLGDPMNPRLNITATEQTKASVATDGGSGRTVLFNCGVKITKTLNDMGLEFIIDAPEDLSLHNELQTMTAENRGKLAVTMLTTGMYLADGNTSSFSMNSALSAFLNSQISSISGSALRTLDLSFGMDNTTMGSGETRTDYSFKFSKRFWNNRLRIVVGGKVSSGADAARQNDTFFDNVTFEYRLSQNSNKYLKLFYDRDSYDWLEGNVEQFGAGFMYRRKLQRLTDIFRFKHTDPIVLMQPNDSVNKQK